MKITIFKTFTMRVLTIVCAATLLAACSDGQMSQRPGVNPSESAKNPLAINSFLAQDASNPDSKSAAKEVTIDEGKGVFLSWDVTGAKAVEITHKSTQRKVDKVDGLKNKTTVEALKADETFILTAEGSDGARVQAQVTVKVRKREIKINFAAKPQEIRAGETSDLCWKIEGVTPKAKVSIIDDEKKEVYPGNTIPDGEPSATSVQKLILAAAIPSAPPADGYGKKPTEEPKKEEPKTEEAKEVCVPASPTKTTTYALTVKDGEKTASQETKIEVKPAPAQIHITFTAQPTRLSGAGETTLSWRVMPEDATVEIDHNVTKDDKANGEKKVSVSETTTFTLTAKTKDDQTKSQAVTVTIGRTVGGKVTAQLLTPSVFAGESVKIAVSSENPAAKLNVYGPRGDAAKFTADGATLTITDAVSGSYVVEADGVLSNPVAVDVRQLEAKDIGAANGLGVQGLGLVITGDANSKAAQVNLTSFAANSKDTSVAYDFGKAFADKMKTHADYMAKFAPYKVNAVVFSPKGRAFAGMTGGVLYSDNSGASWNILDVIPAYDTSYKFKDKEESHPGCFGSTRKGTKSFSASIWMVNVFEVCDLAYDEGTDGKDRLLMATDFGVFYIDGVEGRIKDPANKAHAMQGTLKKDNALFGKVVNRIVIAKAGDQKVVVVAASDGVYVNSQRGDYKAWKQLDAAGLKTAGSVNAIAVSGGTIYAGTDKGLFKSSGLDVTSIFSQVTIAAEPVAVKALAVDAADPSIIYVGTDKGLKLSRNCSASFVDVAAPVGAVRNIATATEGGRSAVVLTSDKGLFSSIGAAGTPGSCAATRPVADTPKESEKPTTSGQRPSPATTGPGTVKP
jgi:hypothetical protein